MTCIFWSLIRLVEPFRIDMQKRRTHLLNSVTALGHSLHMSTVI